MTAEKLSNEPPSLIGRKLGPYQIQVVLGAGGMGEVYRAKDTQLNRTMAIKVLPRLLSEWADLRQRFEREAQAIASLNASLDSVPCVVERILSSVLYNAGAELHSVEALSIRCVLCQTTKYALLRWQSERGVLPSSLRAI